jgi:SAM-dependent methyltransferase
VSRAGRDGTGPGAPSQLFVEWLPALREAAALGPVVDLACGRGRHALASAREGLSTLALDRKVDFLCELAETARREALPLQPVRFDLEVGLAPPIRPGRCGAVLVFRYLHRPLMPAIAGLLAPGGLLLYETFTTAQRQLEGGPRSADFLLEPGELPHCFESLDLVDYREGVHGDRATAALVARAPRG